MSKNRTLRLRASDRNIFEDIRTGKKSIETRAATVKYKSLQVGDTLTFVCGADSFQKVITNVHHWKGVDTMLKSVDLKAVMPHIETKTEMKKTYASFPGYEEKLREHGLIGFEIADL